MATEEEIEVTEEDTIALEPVKGKSRFTRTQKSWGAAAILSNIIGFGVATEEYYTNKHLIETNENLVRIYNDLVSQSHEFVLKCNELVLRCQGR